LFPPAIESSGRNARDKPDDRLSLLKEPTREYCSCSPSHRVVLRRGIRRSKRPAEPQRPCVPRAALRLKIVHADTPRAFMIGEDLGIVRAVVAFDIWWMISAVIGCPNYSGFRMDIAPQARPFQIIDMVLTAVRKVPDVFEAANAAADMFPAYRRTGFRV
jgi:hypothetical protein